MGRTNRSKGPSVAHCCPNTRHDKSIALGRADSAEIGSRVRGSDVIAHIFKSRTNLRPKNEEKNIEFNAGKFKFNAGGKGKPINLLCHKRGDM